MVRSTAPTVYGGRDMFLTLVLGHGTVQETDAKIAFMFRFRSLSFNIAGHSGGSNVFCSMDQTSRDLRSFSQIINTYTMRHGAAIIVDDHNPCTTNEIPSSLLNYHGNNPLFPSGRSTPSHRFFRVTVTVYVMY